MSCLSSLTNPRVCSTNSHVTIGYPFSNKQNKLDCGVINAELNTNPKQEVIEKPSEVLSIVGNVRNYNKNGTCLLHQKLDERSDNGLLCVVRNG